MPKVQDETPQRQPAADEWLRANLAEQQLRYRNIVRQMDRIAADREAWIAAFLERIQTRGFNYNCDALRAIAKQELPAKPDRPFKVVF